jgi:hypothetical protein
MTISSVQQGGTMIQSAARRLNTEAVKTAAVPAASNPVDSVVEQKSSLYAAKAGSAVTRTADEMLGTVLDLKA